MILEKQTQSIIYQEGASQDSIKMSLDMSSAHVLMQMLSKNLYSDAIGSTIRECASNALDSHRRAGTTDPIVVTLSNTGTNYEFTVEDFGIGLDDKDVEEIISKYGKSTKRNSDTELGMMGLGFKAPLAYTSSFYFIARKNGMERKYMMYEGEETNTIDLLYETTTYQRNGVKIIVPLKYGDRYDVYNKIQEQLCYFENVYFNVEGIRNDFTIYRSEHFQMSDMCKDHQMHICLDDVYYPLDLSKLGISNGNGIYIPIGLKFSLKDGIFPTPNRESLIYSQEAIKKIKEKIQIVADYFLDIYNASIVGDCSLQAFMEFHMNNHVRNVKDPRNDKSYIDVASLLKYISPGKGFKSPKLKGMKHISPTLIYSNRDYILQEYEIRHSIGHYSSKFSNHKGYWDTRIQFSSYSRKHYCLIDHVMGERQKRYIKHIGAKDIYFVKKVKSLKLFSDKNDKSSDCYYYLLQLENRPKSLWREIIQEFQGLIKDFIDSFQYQWSDFEPTQEWIDADILARKRPTVKKANGVAVVKKKEDITGKVGVPLEKYNGNNCKFVPAVFKANDLHKTKCLMVYATEDRKEELDQWYAYTKKAKFVILSQRETDKLEKNGKPHNWMHLDEFLKGDNQVLRRAVTRSLLDRLSGKYYHAFSIRRGYILKTLKVINGYSELVEKLNNYYIDNSCEKTISDEIIHNYEKLGKVDTNVHSDYVWIKNLLDKYYFINVIYEDSNNGNHKNMLKELCRYNKIRMYQSCYNLTEGVQRVGANGQYEFFYTAC